MTKINKKGEIGPDPFINLKAFRGIEINYNQAINIFVEHTDNDWLLPESPVNVVTPDRAGQMTHVSSLMVEKICNLISSH